MSRLNQQTFPLIFALNATEIEVDLTNYKTVKFHFPSTLVNTSFEIHERSPDGTWRPITQDGTKLTVTKLAGGNIEQLDTALAYTLEHRIKLVGTVAENQASAADRTIYVTGSMYD